MIPYFFILCRIGIFGSDANLFYTLHMFRLDKNNCHVKLLIAIHCLQAALRLLQLDRVTENLSRQVMEHHEVMGKECLSY